jgi:hypothetical protein
MIIYAIETFLPLNSLIGADLLIDIDVGTIRRYLGLIVSELWAFKAKHEMEYDILYLVL